MGDYAISIVVSHPCYACNKSNNKHIQSKSLGCSYTNMVLPLPAPRTRLTNTLKTSDTICNLILNLSALHMIVINYRFISSLI